MMYKVSYDKIAVKQLQKLDRPTAKKIYDWITDNLVGCENPYLHGKALVGDKSGFWRYRVGDYRIIAEIKNNELRIKIIKIAHRKNVYQ